MRRIYIEFALSLAFLVVVSLSATATADDKNKKQPATTDDDAEPDDAESADAVPEDETATDDSGVDQPAARTAEARAASVGFLHQPIPSTRAGRPITISGKMSRKWVIKRVVLACRWGSDGEWKEIPFRRSSAGNAVATIPVEFVESPGVDYYVYLAPEEEGGEPRELFASRDNPYRVVVHGFSSRSRYNSRLAEWDGRLSRIDINYGYSNFGENLETIPSTTPGVLPTTENTGRGNVYHEVNIAYTYRFLTYLYAMRVEIAGLAHDFTDFKPFTASKDEEIGPGMYAISPLLEFEFAKFFGMSLLLRLGISEEGFEGGGGTSVRVGRIKSTRLDVGFEGMSNAGWRLFLRFEWDTVPHLPMAFNIERTQWYAASSYAEEDWGNRLFYEIKALLPAGIGLRMHVGFAARDQAVKGGLVIGGGAWMDF